MISRDLSIGRALRARQRGFLLNPFRFGGGGAGPTDPNFANVSLLLHMDGTNGSTTFTDSSSAARAITAVGNAQISTAQSKFGGASGLFDGSGDQLTMAFSTAFQFGTADFTIEFWIRPASVSSVMHIFQTCNYDANQFSVRTTATGALQIFFDGGANALGLPSTSNTLTLNTWSHCAVCRASGTTRVFIDGVQGLSTTAAYDVNGVTGSPRIGSRDDTSSFQLNGYLDDFRVTTGVARYTAAFTPPAAAFPNA